MHLEIERKYLVDPKKFKKWAEAKSNDFSLVNNTSSLKQGYLMSQNGVTVRIRNSDNEWAVFCVKTRISETTNEEYEIDIDVKQANRILANLAIVRKTRYTLPSGWVVDKFEGPLKGLWLAEREVAHEKDFLATLPDWCIKDVTGDKRYNNSNLINKKFTKGKIVKK